MTRHLKTCATSGNCEILCKPITGFHTDVEHLWDLVHSEAVKKLWKIFEEDSVMQLRTHKQVCRNYRPFFGLRL